MERKHREYERIWSDYGACLRVGVVVCYANLLRNQPRKPLLSCSISNSVCCCWSDLVSSANCRSFSSNCRFKNSIISWVSVVLSVFSRKLSAVSRNWSAGICHLLPFLKALIESLDIRSRTPRSLRLSLVATSETLKYFLSILAVNGSSRQSVTVKSLLAIGDVVSL